jgi:signal transduction histidine kinase/CheY-like chemotaxis protein/HPt (histidine-containing phosphotransfer) domain-containing protein
MQINTKFSKYSLRIKMLLVTLITIFTAFTIAFTILITIAVIYNYSELKDQLTLTGKTITSNIHSSLVFNDKPYASEELERFHIQKNISSATVYGSNGQIFAHFHNKNYSDTSLASLDAKTRVVEGISSKGFILIYSEKLFLDKAFIGTLVIHYQLQSHLRVLLIEIFILFLVFLISSSFAYLSWLKLQPTIIKPINLLLDLVQQVTKNHDYSLRVVKYTDDEIGQLMDGFNEMLIQIQKRDLLIEAHTSELEEKVIERTDSLLQEKLKAESANRSKSKFLATMSHEIRTPMNAILGFSYLTLRGNLEPQQESNIKNIHQSAEALLTLINDILDFSKMDVGKLDIDHLPFSLSKITNHIKNSLSIMAENKGFPLLIQPAEDVPDYLVGDPNRLQQVLINLVGNAIKFTDSGMVKLAITADDTSDSNKPRISFIISDTGIGINEQQQQNLFKAFSQADASITRKYGGTGLGLAISQKLVHLMGGSISVDSVVDQGTSFYFSLNFERSNESAKEGIIEPSYKKILPTKLKGCRVLVVEDQTINQLVVKAMLEQLGIIVYLANNGLEAVNLIEKNSRDYDLILMDLQMPEMSGYQATDYIRKTLNNQDLPIIVMSANILAGDPDELRQLGFNGYIPKPIEPNHLFEVIDKCYNPSAIKKQRGVEVGFNHDNSNKGEERKSTLLPDSLAGINIETGLKYSGDNPQLYLKLLLTFYENKQTTMDDIKQAFNHQDIEKCQFISHSIKGLAGTLGAENLFEQALYFDQQCKKGIYNSQALSLFEDAFNELMSTLKSLKADDINKGKICQT